MKRERFFKLPGLSEKESKRALQRFKNTYDPRYINRLERRLKKRTN